MSLPLFRKKREKGKKEKKGKPNQEDRTYMSLQKTEPSPEYDTIGQQPHWQPAASNESIFWGICSLYQHIESNLK